jgi:O-antigen/teichoic acid export membrane protein
VKGSIQSTQRYMGILTGAASGLLARGLALTTGLAAVSLTLPYLGKERFGAWATITALQLWLQLADFGLPAGLNNPVAIGLAGPNPDGVRRLIATVIAVVASSSAILFVVFVCLVEGTNAVDLITFNNPSSRHEFSVALIVGVGLTLLGTPNAIVSKVLAIQHKAYWSNLWMSIGQAISIVGLILCSKFELGLVWLTALTTGAVTLCNLGCTIWFFSRNRLMRPRRGDFSMSALRAITPISLSYTVLQSAGMMLSNSSTFIVSATLSPATTAVFAASSRLTGLCTLVAQLSSPYFWASYSDALVRGERKWVRAAFRRHLFASILSALVLTIPLALLGSSIMRWWTNGALTVDLALLYWLLAWQLIVATMNPIGSMLNAHELYRLQTATSLAAGVVGSAVGYVLAPRIGVHVVPASICGAYLVFVVLPAGLQVRRILRMPNT